MKVKPRLIIGLGNPDKKYKNTYHNIGILAIDFLDPASFAELLKSDNYMNQSGLFVLKAAKKYSVKPEEILVIHDDSDIELGEYKLSFGRGSAGHRGVQSIIDSLGTKNFWRLRIGIGKIRKSTKMKAINLVLKKITKSDWKIFKKIFSEIKL